MFAGRAKTNVLQLGEHGERVSRLTVDEKTAGSRPAARPFFLGDERKDLHNACVIL